MAESVDMPVVQPAQRPGELYRHVGDPAAQARTARLWLLMGLGEPVLFGLVGATLGSPLGWIVFGMGAVAGLMMLLIVRPRAARAAAYRGDDLIEIILVPYGPITRGGFQWSWRDVSALRFEAATGSGAGGKVLVTVRLRPVDRDALVARMTSEAQRSVFPSRGGMAMASLGRIDKADVPRIRGLFEQQCAANGVEFDHVERAK